MLAAVRQNTTTHRPDFLVKLLSMVTDENPDLIPWNQGKLFINDPVAPERKMSVYFRHSNFSSFQRQLNNFGFRKVEGKGKLAPCMRVRRADASPTNRGRDADLSEETGRGDAAAPTRIVRGRRRDSDSRASDAGARRRDSSVRRSSRACRSK